MNGKWVFSVRLNQWLGIHLNGFGLPVVGISSWVGSVAKYKFRWLWVVGGGCFSGGYFWLS